MPFFKASVLISILAACFSATIAQRIAMITPDSSARDLEYARNLAEHFPSTVRVLDGGMADAAFRSINAPRPFNMTVGEGRAASIVTGCDFLVLIRTATQRRTSSARPEYYESFAAIYLVSGRTGELLLWRLITFDGNVPETADRALADSVKATADVLINSIKNRASHETPAEIEVVPPEHSSAAVGLKPPIPYRRIKPEYTSTAYLYDIRATVEIEADIGSDGAVLATRIVRWAGYGLDEASDKAVRAMNWRPAMRNGKPLPMRVLLRYNFTKVDSDR